VGLSRLRSLGCADGANFVTARQIDEVAASIIIEEGKTNVRLSWHPNFFGARSERVRICSYHGSLCLEREGKVGSSKRLLLCSGRDRHDPLAGA
jgi:hypothetical protein